MKVIECGGSPLEMGRQYGEQIRGVIQGNIELFHARINPKKKKKIEEIKKTLKRELPDVLNEFEGIAQGANADLDEIVLMNHGDGLTCTPIAIKESKEGNIVAKNNDGGINDNPCFIIRKSKPESGLPVTLVTFAGWLNGLDAMNAEGLASVHGSVGSIYKKSTGRVDIKVLSYSLMRTCRTFDEFADGLMKVPVTGKGFSIITGDKSGSIGVLEAAVPMVELRDVNKQFIYSTNLYMNEALRNSDCRKPERRNICEYRYGYLRWREQNNPPENLEDIKALLSSHEPWAPCRHGAPSFTSRTFWSMITLPREGKILLADGPPCENEFCEIT